MTARMLPKLFTFDSAGWRKVCWGSLAVLALWAVYALSPVRTSTDSRWSLHVAHSFVTGEFGELSEYSQVIEASNFYGVRKVNGRLHSFFPIGTSLLVSPVVLGLTVASPGFVEALHEPRALADLEGTLASFICAVTALVFYLALRREGIGGVVSVVSTLGFAFATPQWSTSSRALWQHGPFALCIVMAIWLLLGAKEKPRRAAWAALPLAFSFVIRPTAAIALAVFGVHVFVRYREQALRFTVLAGAVLVPWLAYNLVCWQSLLPLYYVPSRLGGVTSYSEALMGHLVSPSRGLFIYSPVLILGAVGYVTQRREPLRHALGLGSILHWLLASSFVNWWGGHSYGPRLMADAVPYLAFLSALGLDSIVGWKSPLERYCLAVVGLFGGWSVLVHAQGALSARSFRWNITPIAVSEDRTRLWDWGDPQFARAWQSHEPQRAERASEIRFGDAAVRKYLESGWGSPSPKGVWSVGHRAIMSIPRREDARWIEVKARAFVPAGTPPQTVDVYWEDHHLGTWSFANANWQTRRLDLPNQGTNDDERIRLRFEVHQPRSPKQSGVSNDARLLGILVESVSAG